MSTSGNRKSERGSDGKGEDPPPQFASFQKVERYLAGVNPDDTEWKVSKEVIREPHPHGTLKLEARVDRNPV
jgi:hypothetical protein